MNADDTIDILNDLIEVSKDGEYGFRTSAEHARDQRLKEVLEARADECARAAQELSQEVVALGGKAEDSGTTAGAVHRGWVSIKSKLTRHTDREILEEVERGEDRALDVYQKAAAADLEGGARLIVARQLDGVRRNHAQMRAMRDAVE